MVFTQKLEIPPLEVKSSENIIENLIVLPSYKVSLEENLIGAPFLHKKRRRSSIINPLISQRIRNLSFDDINFQKKISIPEPINSKTKPYKPKFGEEII